MRDRAVRRSRLSTNTPPISTPSSATSYFFMASSRVNHPLVNLSRRRLRLSSSRTTSFQSQLPSRLKSLVQQSMVASGWSGTISQRSLSTNNSCPCWRRPIINPWRYRGSAQQRNSRAISPRRRSPRKGSGTTSCEGKYLPFCALSLTTLINYLLFFFIS